MQVVYIDVLLVVNYVLDFLALYFAGGLLHIPRRRWRLFVAALPGAAFAVIAVLYLQETFWYYPAFVLCGGVMVLIAYGGMGKFRTYVLTLFAHLAAAVVLGGAIGALYGIMDRYISPLPRSGVGKAELLLLLALLGGALVKGLSYLLQRRGAGERVRLRIEAFGRVKNVFVLSDSGDMLTDPLTGRPVIVLAPRALEFLPKDVRISLLEGRPPENERWQKRFRLIPAAGIGGKTLLCGFLPDRLTVAGGRALDAVIAVGEEASYGGTDGVMPPVAGKVE